MEYPAATQAANIIGWPGLSGLVLHQVRQHDQFGVGTGIADTVAAAGGGSQDRIGK